MGRWDHCGKISALNKELAWSSGNDFPHTCSLAGFVKLFRRANFRFGRSPPRIVLRTLTNYNDTQPTIGFMTHCGAGV